MISHRANLFILGTRQLQTGVAILHQFDLIAVWVCDPSLAGIVHAHGNFGDFHPFAFKSFAVFIQPGHFEAEMFVAIAKGQFVHISAPHFRCHLLVEEFKESGIAAFKVIAEGLSLFVVKRELDSHLKFIHIEINDLFKIVRYKIQMRQLPYHQIPPTMVLFAWFIPQKQLDLNICIEHDLLT